MSRLAAAKAPDASLVRVDADHLASRLGEGDRQRQADVAETDDPNLHRGEVSAARGSGGRLRLCEARLRSPFIVRKRGIGELGDETALSSARGSAGEFGRRRRPRRPGPGAWWRPGGRRAPRWTSRRAPARRPPLRPGRTRTRAGRTRPAALRRLRARGSPGALDQVDPAGCQGGLDPARRSPTTMTLTIRPTGRAPERLLVEEIAVQTGR